MNEIQRQMWINQILESIDQTLNQPNNQSNNQSNNQAIGHSNNQSIDQTIDQTINQSNDCSTSQFEINLIPIIVDYILPDSHPFFLIRNEHMINQTNQQSIKQSNDQSNGPSVSEPYYSQSDLIECLIDEGLTVLDALSYCNQSGDPSNNQTINQVISQPIDDDDQVVNHVARLFTADHQPVIQAEIRSINESNNQSNNSTNNQPVNHSLYQSTNQTINPVQFTTPATYDRIVHSVEKRFQSIDRSTFDFYVRVLRGNQRKAQLFFNYQSINQTIDQSLSLSDPLTDLRSTLQHLLALKRSTNQPINQSIYSTLSLADVRHLVRSVSDSQLISRLIGSKSINQSINQSLIKPIAICLTGVPHTDNDEHTNNQSTDQTSDDDCADELLGETIDQSINQSINQSLQVLLTTLGGHSELLSFSDRRALTDWLFDHEHEVASVEDCANEETQRPYTIVDAWQFATRIY